MSPIYGVADGGPEPRTIPGVVQEPLVFDPVAVQAWNARNLPAPKFLLPSHLLQQVHHPDVTAEEILDVCQRAVMPIAIERGEMSSDADPSFDDEVQAVLAEMLDELWEKSR